MDVVIISQCVHLSKHHTLQLKYTSILFVNYISIKRGEKTELSLSYCVLTGGLLNLSNLEDAINMMGIFPPLFSGSSNREKTPGFQGYKQACG